MSYYAADFSASETTKRAVEMDHPHRTNLGKERSLV